MRVCTRADPLDGELFNAAADEIGCSTHARKQPAQYQAIERKEYPYDRSQAINGNWAYYESSKDAGNRIECNDEGCGTL